MQINDDDDDDIDHDDPIDSLIFIGRDLQLPFEKD
jgi:hypothetical protein